MQKASCVTGSKYIAARGQALFLEGKILNNIPKCYWIKKLASV